MTTEMIFIETVMKFDKESIIRRQQYGPHATITSFKRSKIGNIKYRTRTFFEDEKQKSLIKMRLEFEHVPLTPSFHANEDYISYRGVQYRTRESFNQGHNDGERATVPSYRGNVLFTVESAGFRTTLMENLQENDDDEQLFADICTLEDAINPEKNFIELGQLVIKASVLLFKEPTSIPSRPMDELGRRLWNSSNKDFSIIVKNGTEPETVIQAHQCILGAFSSVFNRMLQTDMKEKATSKLILVEFAIETIQSAVEFFYAQDDIESKPLNILLQLLNFAEKYDINELKMKVENVLKFSIFPHTVVEIANAAILFNANQINAICLKAVSIYLDNNVIIDDFENVDPMFTAQMVQQQAVPIVDAGAFLASYNPVDRTIYYWDYQIGSYRNRVTHEILVQP